jgi:hypothetical protein
MTTILFALALAAATPFAFSQTTSPARGAQSDRDAVQQAAFDYIDALYLADPARIERSVHPDLTKRGFWREQPTLPYGPQLTMSYDALVKLAATWNAKKDRDTKIRKVDIYEVLDQTASAKVTAFWGIDYLHLAKYDGRWKIINIVWQAHPK